jgi:acetate kinase
LDPTANAQGGPRITTKASRVTAWIIPTDEELMIARHTMRALGAKQTTEKGILCATP